jgi:hypothetical protein
VRSIERIASRILVVRGKRILLDSDLAALYGVTTKRLNEQVKRNRARFPGDFVFRLSASETAEVVANCDHLARLRYSPTTPFVFTEHGALMASAVLHTPHAVDVSIFVVRAFVRMRESLGDHKALAKRLDELENKVGTHDGAIGQILAAIRQLTMPPEAPKRRRIGFL